MKSTKREELNDEILSNSGGIKAGVENLPCRYPEDTLWVPNNSFTIGESFIVWRERFLIDL